MGNTGRPKGSVDTWCVCFWSVAILHAASQLAAWQDCSAPFPDCLLVKNCIFLYVDERNKVVFTRPAMAFGSVLAHG